MFEISGIYPLHFPALPTTCWRLREVAAFTHFSCEPRRENNKIFSPREVMPASCETARYTMWLPSLYIFKERYFSGQTPIPFPERGSARSRVWRSHSRLCGFAIWCLCVGSVGRQHDIANRAKRPPLFFQHLFRHFSGFGRYFYKVNSCQ